MKETVVSHLKIITDNFNNDDIDSLTLVATQFLVYLDSLDAKYRSIIDIDDTKKAINNIVSYSSEIQNLKNAKNKYILEDGQEYFDLGMKDQQMEILKAFIDSSILDLDLSCQILLDYLEIEEDLQNSILGNDLLHQNNDDYKEGEESHKNSFDPDNESRWGGLSGEEAFLGYWNTE